MFNADFKVKFYNIQYTTYKKLKLIHFILFQLALESQKCLLVILFLLSVFSSTFIFISVCDLA